MKKVLSFLIIALFFVVACEEDEDDNSTDPTPSGNSISGDYTGTLMIEMDNGASDTLENVVVNVELDTSGIAFISSEEPYHEFGFDAELTEVSSSTIITINPQQQDTIQYNGLTMPDGNSNENGVYVYSNDSLKLYFIKNTVGYFLQDFVFRGKK